ncbi:ABC transporter substrate-binding protein [Lysinibacillus composti]|uniref:ABC transporter substrate-binding protein n=1 Tax=Lysinibacillus composti TaxID=720633 RepID=A0A3N9UL67_9BACI|nr:ABC transporter substrate-binding protein [Lysinibacillus composti]
MGGSSLKKLSLIMGMIFVLLLAGCLNAQDAPSNSSSSGEAKDESDGKVYNWKMVSTWGGGSLQYEYDQYFVNLVDKLSDGRLKIKLHAAGELAPATEVLNMVNTGTVEMGSDWPSYWTGTNTAFDLLGSQAMGLTNWDYLLWIEQAGGREIYNEIYGKYNTVYFPTSISGMESGIRSNKPIKSIADFKGLKIRMAGLIQSELIQQLGATPVTLATTEVYEALQRGVVDGAEYSAPQADEMLKVHEVTDYWLTPGFHQTSSVYGVMVNKEEWKALPDDLKAVIEEASKSALLSLTADYTYGDSQAAIRIADSGITLTQLPQADLEKIREIKNGIVKKLASENPDYEKVLQSQVDYLKSYERYRDMQGEWNFGSNAIIPK